MKKNMKLWKMWNSYDGDIWVLATSPETALKKAIACLAKTLKEDNVEDEGWEISKMELVDSNPQFVQ